MKTEEELKEWFLNRFNSCYRLESYIKGNYLLYYHKAYARKQKIQTLLGNELEVPYPKERLSGSTLLFKLDYKNGYLWCNYFEIWSFFEENYSSNDQEIRQLIKGILESDTKLVSLTPHLSKASNYRNWKRTPN